MATRAEVVAEARSWIRTKCQHQANRKGVAADCGGFVGGVGSSLGLEPKDWPNVSRQFAGYGKRLVNGVKAALELYADKIDIKDMQPGDILLLKFEKEPEPTHLAILTEYQGRLGMIHAYYQARKVAEHNIDETWRRRIVGAYAFKGIE